MNDWLSEVFEDRPLWMNALMVFCAFMTFVYVPWDLLWKPVAEDQEVWFGILFTGWGAKLTAPFHWLVYGAGLYGFRQRKAWIAPWGAAYTAQIAFSMLVWNMAEWGFFMGLLVGFVPAAAFSGLALAFWNARDELSAPRPPLSERYGGWALVTGASAGIGEAFARAAAADGMPCVLVARRRDRLEKLAAELERAHGVETRTVPVDLAEPEGADRVADAVADLDVGLLVNNAGFGGIGRFDKAETQRLRDMVQVNCLAVLTLAHRLLPRMIERGRGAMVVTGSVSGRQPLPLHAVYSATKVFDQHLAEALWVETRGTGVDVLCIEPGSTVTEFSREAGQLDHAGETPEQVVATALEGLGRQGTIVSGWLNYLRAMLAPRVASRPMVAFVARDVMAGQTPANRL